MKTGAFILIPVILSLIMASCTLPGSGSPGDEKLLLYARSRELYRQGRFRETANMLAGEKKFIPALVLRGKAEYLSDDLAAAEKSLKRALSLKPGNAEASLFLARLSREKGNKKEAQALIDNILIDNPSDIRALRFAAELARERGATGEAASAVLLDRAVEASAESALVFLDRARQRWAGGNSKGALEDLWRAKALLLYDSPVMKAVETLESIINQIEVPS